MDNLPVDNQNIDEIDEKELQEPSWFDLEGDRQDDNPNENG